MIEMMLHVKKVRFPLIIDDSECPCPSGLRHVPYCYIKLLKPKKSCLKRCSILN